MNILLSALATLCVTIISGIIIYKYKNRLAKISYKVRETIPVKIENNEVGAYLIEIHNNSSKTLKEVTVITEVGSNSVQLKNGGIKATQGIKPEIKITNNIFEVEIPFLKSNDELAITIYAEGYWVPKKPDVTVRSPNDFILENAINKRFLSYKDLINSFFNGIFIGLFGMSLIFFIITKYRSSITIPIVDNESQKEVFLYLCNLNKLPELSEFYLKQENLTYFEQADFIFSKIINEKDTNTIIKYKNLLDNIISYTDKYIANRSKCNILYNLAKIDLILNNNNDAKDYFKRAIKIDSKFVKMRSSLDNKTKQFLIKEKLLE